MLALTATLLSIVSGTPGSGANELRDSIRTVETLRYEATYRRTFAVALETWVAEGTVYIESGPSPALRIDGRVRPPESGDPVELTLTSKDGTWTLLDHSERTYTRAQIVTDLGPAADAAAPLALQALLDPSTLSGLEDVKRLGDTEFAGESCRAFRVRGSSDASEGKWYVSRKSRLPRLVSGARWLPRAERLIESLTLRELVPNPKTTAKTFAPSIPRGYTERPATDVASGPDHSPAELQPVAPLLESLDPLREHFESNRGKPRVVGLFAPT